MAPINSGRSKLPSMQQIAGSQHNTPTLGRTAMSQSREQKSAAVWNKSPKLTVDTDDSSSASSGSESESDGDDDDDDGANWASKITNPSASQSPVKTKSPGIKREEVADSDQERNMKKSALNGSKIKAAASASSDSSDSSSDSDSESSSSDAKKTATAAEEQETSSDSDSEGDSASEASDSGESDEELDDNAMAVHAPAKKLAATINGIKASEKVYDISESEDESSNDEEAEPVSTHKAEDAGKSSDGSQSEPDEAEDDSGMAVAVKSAAAAGTQNGEPAVLGQDFVLRQAAANEDITKVAQLFQEAVATGKQIWYFTAPESVPLSLVEEFEFPLETQDGSVVLSRDGQAFETNFDNATKNSIKLLINSDGQRYKQAPVSVDRVMHVKRITKLPTTETSLDLIVRNLKTPRPQPSGLKARFQPIGVSGNHVGQIGSEEPSKPQESQDIEMIDAVVNNAPAAVKSTEKPVFKMPPPADSATETPKQKKKKSKEAKALPAVPSAVPSSSLGHQTLSQATPSGSNDVSVPTPKSKKVSPVLPPVHKANATLAQTLLPQKVSAPVVQPEDSVDQVDRESEKRKSKTDKAEKKEKKEKEKREKKEKKKQEKMDAITTPAPKQPQAAESSSKSAKRKRAMEDIEDDEDDAQQASRDLASPEKKAKKTRFEKETSVDLTSLDAPTTQPLKQSSPTKPIKSALKSTPLRNDKAASPVPNPHLAAMMASKAKPKTPLADRAAKADKADKAEKASGGGGSSKAKKDDSVKVKKEGGSGVEEKAGVTPTPAPKPKLTPIPLPPYAGGRK